MAHSGAVHVTAYVEKVENFFNAATIRRASSSSSPPWLFLAAVLVPASFLDSFDLADTEEDRPEKNRPEEDSLRG